MRYLLCVVSAAAVALAADPTCSKGIFGSGGTTCCAKQCGRCGGTSCQNLPGGRDDCCTSQISADGRSCDNHDPPCVVSPPAPSPVVKPKRGFVADDAGTYKSCDTPLLLNVSGWFYNYNAYNPYLASGLSGDCSGAKATVSRFTPMNWCISSVNKSVPADVEQTYWMGFNEPNNAHNCNTDAETIARAWGRVMDLHPHAQLVSPATAGNGIKWYDEFFGNCTRLYGSKGCRISYLATHDYNCHADSTLSYLKELYERYGYKVWLTEFSCLDHAKGQPTAAHAGYMAEVLPKLDAADFVYRYAWMSARDSSNLRNLVTQDSNGNVELTILGKMYNAF